MNKKMRAGKWFLTVGVMSLMMIVLFVAITCIVDPFFQYRVKDHSYMLNGMYVCGGLIKNYEYDTLIVGSSMTQNFDMDLFRSELGAKPLHIGLGGMSWRETEELLDAADRAGKASDYYVCIDLAGFVDDAKSTLPDYLLEDTLLAKLRYSLSYESWFRFMPADLGISLLKASGHELPEKYAYSVSIDRLEDWSLDYSFGEDIVLENYQSGAYRVSAVETQDLLERMIRHIDLFAGELDMEGVSYHFFFPPYSSLYWCDAQLQGYYGIYQEAKRYFVEKMTNLGCTVYDFQTAELTMDLNHYKDTTHYGEWINSQILQWISRGEHRLTKENYQDYLAETREFYGNYPYASLH